MKKNSIKFSFALTFSLFCRSKYVLVTMLNIFQCMLKKKLSCVLKCFIVFRFEFQLTALFRDTHEDRRAKTELKLIFFSSTNSSHVNDCLKNYMAQFTQR